MKKIMVFFDIEATHGTTLKKDINTVLDILKKYDILACFNVPGMVAQRNRGIIKRLHKKGHEIASHGYAHENFRQMGARETSNALLKTEKILERITGEPVAGIRLPFTKYNKETYTVIKNHGYKWASNKQCEMPELLEAPHENTNGVINRSWYIIRKNLNTVRMIRHPKTPYKIGSLIEIPYTSSSDGHLLEIIAPQQPTPDEYLNYAYKTLISQFRRSSGSFNLNFHPWLIGSSNRPVLLDDVLKYVAPKSECILPRELEC